MDYNTPAESQMMKDEILQQLGVEGKIDDINNAGQTALTNINTVKTNATKEITNLTNSSKQELESKQDELLEELSQQSAEIRMTALEKQNAEQQEELDSLYNDFKPNTVSGETPITDGVTGSKVETVIDGNSYQETTEGYQLFDITQITPGENNGITLTIDEKGIATLNGTATASALFRSLRKQTISGTGNETIKINQLSGSISGGNLKFIAQDTNYANARYAQISSTDNTNMKLFTDIEFNIFSITIDSGTVCNNLKLGLVISSSKTEYEPYTGGQASPNTEYEQDIEVITECNLVQRGKNEIDFSKPTNNNQIEKFSFENDILSITSKNASYPFVSWDILDIIKRNAGKTLFINFENIDFISSNMSLMQLSITNNNANSYPQLITTLGEKRSYAIPEDVSGMTKCILQLMLNNSTNAKVVSMNITKPILSFEENDTYEPYHYNLIPIDLAGNSLAENDNVKISVNGNVKANKVMKEYVVTGNEDFKLSTNGNGLKYFSLYEVLKDNNSKIAHSNCFKLINDMWNLTEKKDVFKFSDSDFTTLQVMTKNYDTVADFKAFLKERYENGNPVKILYATDKQTIDLPSISPIKLFEGTNNFELVTNLDTTLGVTYKVSNKARLDALENAVLSLGGISNV